MRPEPRQRTWLVCLVVILTYPHFLGIACGKREPEEKPIPRAEAKPGVVETIETGRHLGQAVALLGGEVLVAVDFARAHLTALSDGREADALELGRAPARGLYALDEETVLVLESGGERVFKVGWGGALQQLGAVKVCEAPSLAEVSGHTAWILCRGEGDNLHRLDTRAMEVTGSWKIPGTLADMVMDPNGAWLYFTDLSGSLVRVWGVEREAEIHAIPVSPEPLRMEIATRSTPGEGSGHRVIVTHSNSRHLTWIETGAHSVEHTSTLDVIPSGVVAAPDGGYLYMLAAGAGKLLVLATESKAIEQRYDVPVGSTDLGWVEVGSESRVLMSGGPAGELWVWRPEFANLRLLSRMPMGSAAGRLSLGDGPERIWLLGPQSGRAVRFRIP